MLVANVLQNLIITLLVIFMNSRVDLRSINDTRWLIPRNVLERSQIP